MSAAARTARAVAIAWLALLAIGPLGCGERDEAQEGTAAVPSGLAPDFELTRLGGGRLSLAQQRGKLVLIDFWATWCRPCIEEIPALNAVYARHRAKGFEIIAIAVDDPLTPEQLERWTAERDVSYPVALGSFEIAEEYGAYQFPHHVFVGPNGEYLAQLSPGAHSEEELDAAIIEHLGEAELPSTE